MAKEMGPQANAGGQKPKIQKLNLAQVTTRRRHMLGEEVVMEWDSYTAESSTLAAKLIRNISVESGGVEKPQTLNTHVVDEFPGDVVLISSIEADESSITARWVSSTKVRLYLEKLLKVRPLKIPRGFRAHIPVSRYVVDESVGLRLHLSEVRFAEVGATSGAKPASSSDGKETASSTAGKETASPSPAKETASPSAGQETASPSAGKETVHPSAEKSGAKAGD